MCYPHNVIWAFCGVGGDIHCDACRSRRPRQAQISAFGRVLFDRVALGGAPSVRLQKGGEQIVTMGHVKPQSFVFSKDLRSPRL